MDDPSLEDMTRAASRVLNTKEEGFVVFIEARPIDHGHHGNKAWEALEEALQLDQAVTAALELVNTDETLIIVTADNSHAMTLNSYCFKGKEL